MRAHALDNEVALLSGWFLGEILLDYRKKEGRQWSLPVTESGLWFLTLWPEVDNVRHTYNLTLATVQQTIQLPGTEFFLGNTLLCRQNKCEQK